MVCSMCWHEHWQTRRNPVVMFPLIPKKLSKRLVLGMLFSVICEIGIYFWTVFVNCYCCRSNQCCRGSTKYSWFLLHKIVALERFLARLCNTKWDEIQVGRLRWTGAYLTVDLLLGYFKRGIEGLNKLHSSLQGSSKSERSMLLGTEEPCNLQPMYLTKRFQITGLFILS